MGLVTCLTEYAAFIGVAPILSPVPRKISRWVVPLPRTMSIPTSQRISSRSGIAIHPNNNLVRVFTQQISSMLYGRSDMRGPTSLTSVQRRSCFAQRLETMFFPTHTRHMHGASLHIGLHSEKCRKIGSFRRCQGRKITSSSLSVSKVHILFSIIVSSFSLRLELLHRLKGYTPVSSEYQRAPGDMVKESSHM